MPAIKSRAAPLLSEVHATILVVIILGTLCGLYIAAIVTLYLYSLARRAIYSQRCARRKDAANGLVETSQLARILFKKPAGTENLYSRPVMRSKLFSGMCAGRRCSAFDVRRITHFTPSPLRHVLFIRSDADNAERTPLLAPPPVIPVPILQSKAGANVKVVLEVDVCKPMYSGLYRWGSVTHVLGKSVKGASEPLQGVGKENQAVLRVVFGS